MNDESKTKRLNAEKPDCVFLRQYTQKILVQSSQKGKLLESV